MYCIYLYQIRQKIPLPSATEAVCRTRDFNLNWTNCGHNDNIVWKEVDVYEDCVNWVIFVNPVLFLLILLWFSCIYFFNLTTFTKWFWKDKIHHQFPFYISQIFPASKDVDHKIMQMIILSSNLAKKLCRWY